MEVAGVVAEVGADATGWSVGQEVCALLAGGGYAEHVAVPRGRCCRIRRCRPHRRRRPAQSGLHGVVEPGAHRAPGRRPAAAAARRSQRHRDPRHPGGTGVGRAGGGHRRIAEKLEFCRDLGAQLTINYCDEDFVARLREETNGADVNFDIMGASYRTAISTPGHRRGARHHRHAGGVKAELTSASWSSNGRGLSAPRCAAGR